MSLEQSNNNNNRNTTPVVVHSRARTTSSTRFTTTGPKKNRRPTLRMDDNDDDDDYDYVGADWSCLERRGKQQTSAYEESSRTTTAMEDILQQLAIEASLQEYSSELPSLTTTAGGSKNSSDSDEDFDLVSVPDTTTTADHEQQKHHRQENEEDDWSCVSSAPSVRSLPASYLEAVVSSSAGADESSVAVKSKTTTTTFRKHTSCSRKPKMIPSTIVEDDKDIDPLDDWEAAKTTRGGKSTLLFKGNSRTPKSIPKRRYR